ncbi:MAG: bifunctional demethylmenaquinone methyltransferase/2-methoxy-6-polyprenyl-1,4-benzoquinol methylase UbiE [Desulfobacteraceae bacterium]|nr:bifunctional demethylmenaquinone methyltransferase/2-methoxy-6-polyprenyl-1,4-benzoquinol methylase UbiE [Desulfobacteraceae bacterium]
MALWQNPGWFDASNRREQLDDHIRGTGKARFGIRTFSEKEKAFAVRKHFNKVAPKYDFMNSLLSFGIQHAWKRQAVRMLNILPGQNVIDICAGTGDLSILAARKTGKKGRVILYDINHAMIQAGRHKIDPYPDLSHIRYVLGDAEKIPFPDQSFDAAMAGFGIRNLTHLKRGFCEMHRILKPGGRFVCLEFSRPLNPVFRSLYDFYSFNIMPFLGEVLTGSAESYTCLPETIRMFPLPDELSAILGKTGFGKITYKVMTNAIAVAHTGVKTKNEVRQ